MGRGELDGRLWISSPLLVMLSLIPGLPLASGILGHRLAVGRLALDQQAEVRILVPQPANRDLIIDTLGT